MKRRLTIQELHNLAMNIVGKDLEAKNFEFIAINSKLKKNPQYVCVDKNNQRYFVVVKTTLVSEKPVLYDVVWMETFKVHAKKHQAKIIYAWVGLSDKDNALKPPFLNEEYLVQYDGLQYVDVALN